jgi:cysteinyl-tRNA synthetase
MYGRVGIKKVEALIEKLIEMGYAYKVDASSFYGFTERGKQYITLHSGDVCNVLAYGNFIWIPTAVKNKAWHEYEWNWILKNYVRQNQYDWLCEYFQISEKNEMNLTPPIEDIYL